MDAVAEAEVVEQLDKVGDRLDTAAFDGGGRWMSGMISVLI
jgi:hypothetical protein